MNKQREIGKLMFNGYAVWHRKEWYRMLTSGFIHAGYGHLMFNMMTLYFFGPIVEEAFGYYFGVALGGLLYIILYISAIAVSSIADLMKFRDTPAYNALGASGAVSAVLFSAILFQPDMGISIFFIPFYIPAYIFAPLYLAYCWYMARLNIDNIGHTAHFCGAVYGLMFPIILEHRILIDTISANF
jgi:membrane associated rhomboid family serine protease